MSEKFGYPKGSKETPERDFSGPDYADMRLPEMKELLQPLKVVVEKLRENIKNGEYNLIIGDDASGRVPALILYQFIRDEYKKQQKTIDLVFLAGSRETKDLDDKKARMKEFLSSRLKADPHVLVATELIHRGDSLVPLTDVLKEMDAAYDVATVGVLREYRLPALEEKLGTGIIFGEESHPKIDGDNIIAGVEKDYEDIFSTPLSMDENQRKTFLDGRHDVDVLAKRIGEYYNTLE